MRDKFYKFVRQNTIVFVLELKQKRFYQFGIHNDLKTQFLREKRFLNFVEITQHTFVGKLKCHLCEVCREKVIVYFFFFLCEMT